MRRNTGFGLLACAVFAAAPALHSVAPADPAAGVVQKDLKSPALALGAAEWLLKVSESSRHVSYQGVVVYRDGENLETLRIVHRHKNGREQERFTSLSGAPRDLVREGDQIRCALPHDHLSEITDRPQNLLPALSRTSLQAVTPHYAFRDLGEARVAGRASRGVAIEPRDEFRYGYEVWADVQTAVPLKVSLLDRKGRVIEQMLYTEVQFPDSIPDRAFALGPGVRSLTPPLAWPPAASQAAQSSQTLSNAWTLAGLPPGFKISMRSLNPAVAGEGPVEHVLLSDGLSAVSVFSARVAQHDKLFRGFSHLGAMNAYGRMVGAFHVTVVGEVPQATVRMIGDGLTPAAQ